MTNSDKAAEQGGENNSTRGTCHHNRAAENMASTAVLECECFVADWAYTQTGG